MEVRNFKEQDLDVVCDLHMWAFKDHLNVLLGKTYIRAFLKWFIGRDDCINVVGIMDQGATGGYIVGASWGYQQQMNRSLLKIAAIEMFKRPWLLVHKKIIFSVCLRIKTMLGLNKFIGETSARYEGKILSLVGIGVAENAQGSGIATRMMEAFINQAKGAGYDFVRLSVYSSNERARRFYEKTGWQPEITNKPVMGYYKKL